MCSSDLTQETQVQSLGVEDALEKGMATYPVFLPGKSQGERGLAGYSPWSWSKSWTLLSTHQVEAGIQERLLGGGLSAKHEQDFASECRGIKGRAGRGSIGRNDAQAETPVLWPPHEKS